MSLKANNNWDIIKLGKLADQVRLGISSERNKTIVAQEFCVIGPSSMCNLQDPDQLDAAVEWHSVLGKWLLRSADRRIELWLAL